MRTLQGLKSIKEMRSAKIRERTLLEPLSAVLAIQARIREPFDTDAVPKLDWGGFGESANSDDNTDTLRDNFSRQEQSQWPRS